MNILKKLFLVICPILFSLAISKEVNAYKLGDYVEHFALPSIDNKIISLPEKGLNGAIIIFTCNHCPFSVAYEDRIIELHDKYSVKGYPVIAINPNDNSEYPEDDFEHMKQRAKEKDFNFPYLFDKGQKVYPKFEATKTPHVFLTKKDKKGYKVVYIGAIDDNYKDAKKVNERYLEIALEDVLNNKPVSNPKTIAIGCSIKRFKH